MLRGPGFLAKLCHNRSRLGQTASRHRSEGIFPLPQLLDLPVWSSSGLTGGQRPRLSRDVNGACNVLNWMHGEDSRLRLALSLLRPARTRINVFVRTCSSVSSWRLCVGLMLTAPSTWCLVQRRLLRVLLGQPSLDSVVDAPPIEMLSEEARFFLEEFQ